MINNFQSIKPVYFFFFFRVLRELIRFGLNSDDFNKCRKSFETSLRSFKNSLNIYSCLFSIVKTNEVVVFDKVTKTATELKPILRNPVNQPYQNAKTVISGTVIIALVQRHQLQFQSCNWSHLLIYNFQLTVFAQFTL